jgi:hypothetical protein
MPTKSPTGSFDPSASSFVPGHGIIFDPTVEVGSRSLPQGGGEHLFALAKPSLHQVGFRSFPHGGAYQPPRTASTGFRSLPQGGAYRPQTVSIVSPRLPDFFVHTDRAGRSGYPRPVLEHWDRPPSEHGIIKQYFPTTFTDPNDSRFVHWPTDPS